MPSRPRPFFDLPIKLDSVSNGEFVPPPSSPQVQRVQRIAHERIVAAAARKGVDRRAFLRSSCASAIVLTTMNELLGCRGGRYSVEPGAELDEAAAQATLAGEEFIFDVQTHHVSTSRDWFETNTVMAFLANMPQARCSGDHWTECYSRELFVKEIFLDSDTHLGVLSALAGGEKNNPLHAEEAAQTRDAVAALDGSPRLRIHGIVLPNLGTLAENRDHMAKLTEQWDIAAWKLYTIWGPEGRGYFLDGDLGHAVIEHMKALRLPLLAVHKGLPLPGMDPAFTWARDIGPVAHAHPDVTFLIYHSGFDPGRREGPYDPRATTGVDGLIASLQERGIGAGDNVYAELGSTWRALMSDPDQAAHLMGKLLRFFGEDRILWGTDSIWYGSPQDQIQAFRAFEISPEFQERYGYPPLTPQAKAKILGLNGARVYGLSPAEVRAQVERDPVARVKQAYREQPAPSFRTYGPRTRRELLELVSRRGGLPT